MGGDEDTPLRKGSWLGGGGQRRLTGGENNEAEPRAGEGVLSEQSQGTACASEGNKVRLAGIECVGEGTRGCTGGRTVSCILLAGPVSHAAEVAFFLGQWAPSVDSGWGRDSLTRKLAAVSDWKRKAKGRSGRGEGGLS